MNIKMDSFKSFYEKGKEIAKEAAKEAKTQFDETIAPKVNDAVSEAVDWADKNYPKAKESIKSAYNTAKQKTEPKVREAIAYAQFAINPPKTEVLAKKAADAQKKFLQKGLSLKDIERRFPDKQMLVMQAQKELNQLEQKAQTAVAKYSDFVAKEKQAQEAFNILNSANK